MKRYPVPVAFSSGLLSILVVFLVLTHSQNSKLTQAIPLKVQGAETTVSIKSAWIASWNSQKALTSLKLYGDKLNSVLPAWYQVSSDGILQSLDTQGMSDAILSEARAHNLHVLPSIGSSFDPTRVEKLMNDTSLRSKFISDLIAEASKKHYDGFDIDWEQMNPSDETQFTSFISDLSQSLRSKNLLLSISLEAKTGTDEDQASTASENWDTLGRLADQLRIMAYDFHYEQSDPGPTTPLLEYREVIAYSLTHLPKEKIVMGLPTYGYEWILGKVGTGYQYDDMQNRITQIGVQTLRDDRDQTLHAQFRSNDGVHELWFDDALSIAQKIQIAQTSNINQFSFWHLGGEDERIWSIQ